MTSALVTGCAGFIGSHLTESLLADCLDVVGIDCFNDNYGSQAKLDNLEGPRSYGGFTFLPVDLSKGELGAAVDACDVIFHLAAEPGVRTSWGARFEQCMRNNVLATQRLLEAARHEPGRRFVYASHSSVYGDAEAMPTTEDAVPAPRSPYGASKLAGEQLCDVYRREHDLGTVALRFFSVYGPRQRPDMAFHAFCRAIVRREPLHVLGSGAQTRDFTYVGDVVRALRSAAVAPGVEGRAFNVGGGARVSVNEAIERLAGLAGRPLDVRRAPRAAGDVRDTGADITRARAALGYEPLVAVADGLAAEFAWMEEREGRSSRLPKIRPVL